MAREPALWRASTSAQARFRALSAPAGGENARGGRQPRTLYRDPVGADGALFGGRYDPLEALGEEAGCEMFRALDRQHERQVWLGVRSASSSADRAELLRSAQAQFAVVPHPGLPVMRDDFFDGDRHVLVRDWVDGTPLDLTLTERGDPGLPPSAVLRWLAQAAEILDHLHRQAAPFPHGAVCPAYLVLGTDGRVSLVNSGIGVSSSGSLAEPWLAPEIIAGEAPSPAADIYGFAATAFTLLTGIRDVVDASRWDGIDPALVKVAQRALRRGLDPDPARRPKSARELVERLEHAYEADLPTGELTFCLTDVVDSTPLWEANPEAMQAAMTRLRDLIADLVDRHGGRLPRSQGEGDSTLSVFARAESALATIVSIHRALAQEEWPGGIDLRVRAGLHTGNADVRDGDYFGPTVNRAARVRGLADGRHTMVSAATASLVSEHLPVGTQLVARGAHKLKGLSRPEDVFELVDEQMPATGAGASGDPTTAVAGMVARPFAGGARPAGADRIRRTRSNRPSAARTLGRGGLQPPPGLGRRHRTGWHRQDASRERDRPRGACPGCDGPVRA